MLDLCFDPQTSGGLLIAVAGIGGRAICSGGCTRRESPRRRSSAKCSAQARAACCFAPDGRRPIPAAASPSRRGRTTDNTGDEHNELLRAAITNSDSPAAERAPAASPRLEQKFQEFLQAAGAPGALDAKTKQAIAIALSVLARCEPCVKSHLKKAREMGFSQEEIDEAAWMAIAFGGSPTMVFYNGVRKAAEPISK